MRIVAVALAAFLACASAFVPQEALSHAALVESQPRQDAALAAPPEVIVLRFNEPVRPVMLRLLDGEGQTIADRSTARVVGTSVELPLAEDLSPGGYIVTWRMVSADSHPISGSFGFSVGPEPGRRQDGLAQRTVESPWAWALAAGVVRAIFLASLLTAAGATWFIILVCRGETAVAKSAVGLARPAALLGAVAGLLGIGLQGGLLLAARPFQLLDSEPWRTALATPIGLMQLVAAMALLLLFILQIWPGRGLRTVAACAAGLLAVLSLAFAGHAASAEPRLLTSGAIAVHAAAAAFWFGALPPLLFALRVLPDARAAALLQRFSSIAVGVVLLLLAAGTTLAVVQVRQLEALWQTGYGVLLSAKIILVLALFMLAVQNKRSLTNRLAAGSSQAKARFRRNIALEIAIMIAVVALTTLLGFNTPPRALSQAAGDASDREQTVEKRTKARGVVAFVQVSPGSAGSNVVRVSLEDESGSPVDPIEVAAGFSSLEHGIEPTLRQLDRRDGHFALETGDMALPGTWQVRLDVLVTEFDKLLFEVEVQIAR